MNERFMSGQKVVAATAEQLLTNDTFLSYGIWLRSLSTNAGVIYLHHNAGTTFGYILDVGAEVLIPVDKLSKVYVSGTPGDILSWIAT